MKSGYNNNNNNNNNNKLKIYIYVTSFLHKAINIDKLFTDNLHLYSQNTLFQHCSAVNVYITNKGIKIGSAK